MGYYKQSIMHTRHISLIMRHVSTEYYVHRKLSFSVDQCHLAFVFLSKLIVRVHFQRNLKWHSKPCKEIGMKRQLFEHFIAHHVIRYCEQDVSKISIFTSTTIRQQLFPPFQLFIVILNHCSRYVQLQLSIVS